LLVAGIVYLLIMLFGHLADHLILFPTRAAIDVGGAVRKTIPFENGELEIWTARSARAQQQGRADVFILRFYGNADRADRWPGIEAELWNDRAVEIWGMNYPGFGGSTGPARLARIGPAAVVTFDELKRRAGEVPVIAYGTSIGATAALHVAALTRNNPAPVWLVERVALGGAGRIADPARSRQHSKWKGEPHARDFPAGRER
jgi:hypothetical protein